MALFKTTPHLLEKIWGGEYLNKINSSRFPYPIGESLEVSILNNQNCKVRFNSELVDLGDLLGSNLKYLIKFLDTSDNLSVQVHPDDQMAKNLENSNGKTECWFIISADVNAGIYLGFKEGVTKSILEKALHEKENINELMNFYKVSSGEFFYVPAGTVHAIGSGVVLCEVQQSSGITYRVWDWNRVDKDNKSRKLHIDKALSVLNFEKKCNDLNFFRYQNKLLSCKNETLINHKDFSVEIFNIEQEQNYRISEKEECSIIFIDGIGNIDNNSYRSFESFVKTGDNVVNVQPKSKTTFLKIY